MDWNLIYCQKCTLLLQNSIGIRDPNTLFFAFVFLFQMQKNKYKYIRCQCCCQCRYCSLLRWQCSHVKESNLHEGKRRKYANKNFCKFTQIILNRKAISCVCLLVSFFIFLFFYRAQFMRYFSMFTLKLLFIWWCVFLPCGKVFVLFCLAFCHFLWMSANKSKESLL